MELNFEAVNVLNLNGLGYKKTITTELKQILIKKQYILIKLTFLNLTDL